MGLFDREVTPPAPREAKYTVEKTAELVQQLGMLRLKVRDPRLKVMITKIAWEAVPSLEQSSGGKPTGDVISRMMTSVAWLIETLEGYVKIQDNPNPDVYASKGGAMALLQRGSHAVDQFYRQMATSQNPANNDLGSYEALTDFLSGTSKTIQ